MARNVSGISPAINSGFNATLQYGAVTLRLAVPVSFSGQPAISVAMGNRDGFVSSTNFDSSTGEVVVSLAMMNFSAANVYLRVIAIGKVS